MAQMMLVNPSKRKGKKMATRKRRTPAQKRATAKLVAFNKKRRAPAKRKTPARKTTARKAPAKRATTRRRTTPTKYRRNPAPRRTRKNMIQNIVEKQLKPAAIQASGALMLDVGYGYLGGYIPDVLNQGMMRHATKGVVAIALGFVASNFIKAGTANELAKGAMTVTLHDAMKEAVETYAPQVPLGYYNASPVYAADELGYFSHDNGTGLGYYSDDMGSGYSQGMETEAFDTSDI